MYFIHNFFLSQANKFLRVNLKSGYYILLFDTYLSYCNLYYIKFCHFLPFSHFLPLYHYASYFKII
jgi:hypothetical protein